MQTRSRAVVVTGASSGIGWGTAKVLCARGVRVFGSVRRQADADRLAAEFGAAFTPLIFDITDEAAVHRGATQAAAALGNTTLFGLVNNAGIAAPGPLLHQPIAEFRYQLEVNLVAQLTVTQAFAPLLGADLARQGQPGRIINISSVGGKIGAPFVGAYVAAKHGLEGMSESLRRELMLYGIDVIVIGPGAIATPIWDKAEKLDLSPYEKTGYGPIVAKVRDYMMAQGRHGFPPERVGELVWHALTTPHPRTRYALVPGKFMNWVLPRVLPQRLLDRTLAKQLGLRREPTGRSRVTGHRHATGDLGGAGPGRATGERIHRCQRISHPLGVFAIKSHSDLDHRRGGPQCYTALAIGALMAFEQVPLLRITPVPKSVFTPTAAPFSYRTDIDSVEY